MRSLALIGLVGAAACGDTGLALTINAPPDLAFPDRVELVLASGAPDKIVEVHGQLTGGSVLYYRRKFVAGTLTSEDLTEPGGPGGLDGYTVRIESRDGAGGDELVVPFVIAYRASRLPGEPDQPIGIGVVPDRADLARALPLALPIRGSSRIEATVDMVSLLPGNPALGIMTGQVAEIRCGNLQGPSGIAWQPGNGTQLRLLYPDPAGGATDAVERPLDLDCDRYAADRGDCDDVRPRFNPGAQEQCDGEDTNCDAASFTARECTTSACAIGPNVQLCHDLDNDGSNLGDCVTSPECQCAPGSPLPCKRCVLPFEGEALARKPCLPGLGKVRIETCTLLAPCTVELATESGGWKVAIATDPEGPFGPSATMVTGDVWLRVKYEGELLAPPGAAHLVIKSDVGGISYVGYDLVFGDQAGECDNITDTGGTYKMECF